MTENIKCPCCGSGKINEYHHSTYSICEDCQCSWDESKRQPPNAWIACSERLPENKAFVLVYAHRVNPCTGTKSFYYYAVDRLDHEGKWLWSEYKDDKVTHWQPLPQPPVTRKAGE